MWRSCSGGKRGEKWRRGKRKEKRPSLHTLKPRLHTLNQHTLTYTYTILTTTSLPIPPHPTPPHTAGHPNRCSRYLKYTDSIFTSTLTPPNPHFSTTSKPAYVTDAGDPQWTSFRSSLPLLTLFAVCSTLLGLLLKSNSPKRSPSRNSNVNLLIGSAFVLYIHGAGTAFPLVFTVAFYRTTKALAGTKYHTPVIWTLALFTIFAKEVRGW